MIVRYGKGVPIVPQDEAEHIAHWEYGRIRGAIDYGQHLADSQSAVTDDCDKSFVMEPLQ